ncbi:MAG TPA: NHL repeat-containing protein [candidate division Zixibacteria bacterium]|nr:NHL repeat-containing protein [candidate division Zixibacteria bacterium]
MSLKSSFQITGAPGKGLESPASFAYDFYRERILVANTGANTVDVYTAGGEYLFRIGETGGLSAPLGAAALSSGQVVILQEKSNLLKIYDEGTQQLDTFNLTKSDSTGKTRISRIFADGRDNLYLLDVGSNRILVLDKSWKRTAVAGATGRGRPQRPVDLALDNAGRIYLADESDCPIRVFDPKGRFLSCLEKYSPGWNTRWRPAGICVDSKNRIWAIDEGTSTLRVFDANGNLLQTIDSADGGMRRFFFPVQIILDRYGQLYLLEKGKNTIEVFQIENY